MTTVTQPTFARAWRHRSQAGRLVRRIVAVGLVLVLAVLLCAAPSRARAQADVAPQGIVISVNGNETRKTTSGKNIKKLVVSDPTRADARLRTPTDYIIIGIAPGIARVTVTDADDKVEILDVVVVQFDIRQLEQVLRKAVPGAAVKPIPAGNNAVILQGTVDRTEDLQAVVSAAQSVVGTVQIINMLRVGGVQQVQLDVVVAQVSRSELRAMSFNFFSSSRNFFLGSTVGQAVANPTLVGQTSTFLNIGGVLSGQPGSPNGLPTNFLVGVLHDSWGFLKFLQALRNEGVLKLMAEPRLVTMSGRQASFLSGGEQAIPVPAGLGQVGVQFEEFGTRLNFVPIVLGNGKIHLEVEPEVSSLDPSSGTVIGGTTVPGRNTQRVRTTVELESGQTFVIGGLIQHTVQGTTQKVPVLGDLPLFGAAFSNKSFNETETEVLIMVTPHLVDPLACDQYPKVLPGQETRTPDDFELFLEGILEAPRGQRQICHGKTYVPAFKNDPTAGQFPCGDQGDCKGNGRGRGFGHRGKGSCTSGCGVQNGSTSMGVPVQHGQVAEKSSPARLMPPAPPSSSQSVSIREVEPIHPARELEGGLVTPASLPPLEVQIGSEGSPKPDGQ